MVLAELGGRITNALRTMTSNTVIDEEAVDNMLKEIASVRFRCFPVPDFVLPPHMCNETGGL